MSTQHTPGQVCDYPADDDPACQLHWAEHHANNLGGMAEHNRKHFATEAIRLRAAITKAHEHQCATHYFARAACDCATGGQQ